MGNGGQIPGGVKTIVGKDYPKPIVIHEKARAAALEAFQLLKK